MFTWAGVAATPLHLAATKGDTGTVKALVEKGADVNARTADGLTTPLHCAATEVQLETVRLLAKMGGDVHAQDANGSIPLLLAAYGGLLMVGHEETVRVLVEMGTDVNAGIASGLTPLHFEVLAGHLETLKVLTEMGAKVHVEFSERRFPLQVAEESGHEAVASFLRKFTKNDRRSKSKAAPALDPAAQAAAEVAAAAMAALLLAEEEDHKPTLPSKQRNSNRARKHNNRKKANRHELDTGPQGLKAISGSVVASSSGRRDDAGGRDDLGRDVAGLLVHTQQKLQQSGIDIPLSAITFASAIASAETSDNTCIVCLAAPKDSLLLLCNHMTM
jgi:ankyrin repeat protein